VLWRNGVRSDEDAARWTAEDVDDFRRRRSTSVAAILARQLAVDLVVNAAAAAALVAAVWVNRFDPLGCGLALAGLALTFALRVAALESVPAPPSLEPRGRRARCLDAPPRCGPGVPGTPRHRGGGERLAPPRGVVPGLLPGRIRAFPPRPGRSVGRHRPRSGRSLRRVARRSPRAAPVGRRHADGLREGARRLEPAGIETAERRAGRILVGALALIGLVFAAGLLFFLAGRLP
jgi:hypothetical protein